LSRTASARSSTEAPERKDSAFSSPPLSRQDQNALAKNLYAAACAGDLKHIRLLLSLGAPINTPIMVEGLYDAFKPAKPGSLSALAGAAGHGQLGAARLLLANGAALNPTMKQSSSSPLHQACRADDAEMAAFLLEHGADVDSYNTFKTTPLMYAAKHGSPTLVYLLLLYRPDIHKLSFINTAAIHWSLWPGNEEVMELLLQAGADPDHPMGDGSTPLHCAALSELPKVARTLLRYGANPLKRNEEWKTPLQVAGEMGHLEVAGVLREAEEMR
jgi:ankyrin repeat protein